MTLSAYAADQNDQAAGWKHRPGSPLPHGARERGRARGPGGTTVEVDYKLPEQFADHNLLPEVRSEVLAAFSELEIPWHQGRRGHPSAHLRSSQVQCANALGLMMRDAQRIERAFGAVLGIASVRPLGDVCDVHETERDRYLTFEFLGPKNYLNEWPLTGTPPRGAQTTSVDAAFAYVNLDGQRELALVEWKFTECYRGRGAKWQAREGARLARYSSLLNDPECPINTEGLALGDLFHEPIYQLVRQQLLAWQLEADAGVDATTVRVVHVVSSANTAYDRSYMAPSLRHRGATVEEVWKSLLRTEDRYLRIEPDVFQAPSVTSASYVERYGASSAKGD